jgi:hypothetical protein
MQGALDLHAGIFHVHRHDHHGQPRFSGIDVKSLLEFLPAFARIHPEQVHGALLFSQTEIRAVYWDGKSERLKPIPKIVLVGFPTRISIEEQIPN